MRWLDGREPCDLVEWVKLWETLDIRRPHDNPSFIELIGLHHSTPVAVIYEEPHGSVFYAFSWRRLNRFEYFNSLEEEYFDIVSPYGYGGPLYSGKDE
ncbi:hypothetical protein LCGC14_2667260, partial [marine sediment metagenome]